MSELCDSFFLVLAGCLTAFLSSQGKGRQVEPRTSFPFQHNKPVWDSPRASCYCFTGLHCITWPEWRWVIKLGNAYNWVFLINYLTFPTIYASYIFCLHTLLCSVTQPCPTVCDPMDCSLPGSYVRGISPVKDWSGLPFPLLGDLPGLLFLGLLHWQADSLLLATPRKPCILLDYLLIWQWSWIIIF